MHLRGPLLAILAGLLITLAIPSEAVPSDGAPVIDPRFASCDLEVIRSAADEVFSDTRALHELPGLYATIGLRMAGRREDAAFLFLATRLREFRKSMFEKADPSEQFALMDITFGRLVAPATDADAELARKVFKRVTDWDRSRPDPFRDGEIAKTGDYPRMLATLDAVLETVPEIANDPVWVAEARLADREADRLIQSGYAQRCAPRAPDLLDKVVYERITSEAAKLIMTHPLALRRAGGALSSVSFVLGGLAISGLPGRLPVWVKPVRGKTFYAEVGLDITVTPDQRLDAIKTSLGCISDFGPEDSDVSWQDFCRNEVDPVDTGRLTPDEIPRPKRTNPTPR